MNSIDPAIGKQAASRKGFSIFRRADAKAFSEIDVMDYVGVTPEMEKSIAALQEAGIENGQAVKLLFSAPGFSLTYAWFKSGFPLPRHSHNADCLYYVIAGSLILGSETLGPGDGFFVPNDAAYSYVPGPQGVEVLEFRHEEHFNIRFLAKNPAFWSKAAETVKTQMPAWRDQPPPGPQA
jgi:hypothetical protein